MVGQQTISERKLPEIVAVQSPTIVSPVKDPTGFSTNAFGPSTVPNTVTEFCKFRLAAPFKFHNTLDANGCKALWSNPKVTVPEESGVTLIIMAVTEGEIFCTAKDVAARSCASLTLKTSTPFVFVPINLKVEPARVVVPVVPNLLAARFLVGLEICPCPENVSHSRKISFV